jgi:general secretion pathway protein B
MLTAGESMSFILDALKKSESDRQRQGGPALFEVKVAAPRRALPLWAVAIAVLFAANLAVVIWLLMRHGAPPAEVAQPAAAVSAATAVREPARTPTPLQPAPVTPGEIAINAPIASPPAVSPAARSLVSAPAEAPPASNPDDFAPAAEPPPSGSIGRVKRGTESGVPLYQQLAATPASQLPQLRLDLHAYAARAEDRWVLINMHRLREGDSLEGVHVERITPEGAVLSYRGSQFLLTRE